MSTPSPNKCCSWGVYAIAILGTFMIVGWLVCQMIRHTRPEAIGQERGEERRKAALELKAADTQALNNLTWQDQSKQIVRLPINRAMELTVQEWKNPAAARKTLLERLDKATAPAPKPPEAPSEFE